MPFGGHGAYFSSASPRRRRTTLPLDAGPAAALPSGAEEMPMFKFLTPKSIRPPFAKYSHGVEVPSGKRLIVCSGQLGVGPDDSIPEDAGAQAELCFSNISAVLAEAGLGLKDIVRINAYVTDRAHMKAYMAVRDRLVAEPPPASTLMIVSGFTRPEFKVEIEAIAAG
jgi:enamine deaminase RidA (YjgF/YER057c/UK114 family)